jgi:hypothetical protein
MIDQPVAGYDYTKQDEMYRQGSTQTRGIMDRQNTEMATKQGQQQYGEEWLKGRDPYYQALQKQYVQTQQPGLEQQYADALKQQGLQAASAGNRTGSQRAYQGALAQGQYASGLGQAQLQGEQLANQQQASDQKQMYDWLANIWSQGSATMAQNQAGMGAVQQGANTTQQYQNTLMQQMQMQQNLANQRSQFYGGLIGNVTGAVNTFKSALPMMAGAPVAPKSNPSGQSDGTV